MRIKYLGTWQFTKGRSLRLFNLILADGRQPTFAVGKGEDIKTKNARLPAQVCKGESRVITGRTTAADGSLRSGVKKMRKKERRRQRNKLKEEKTA